MLLSRKLTINPSLPKAVKYEVSRLSASSWKINNKSLAGSGKCTVVLQTVNVIGLYCVEK
jgi:hypothetical protein